MPHPSFKSKISFLLQYSYSRSTATTTTNSNTQPLENTVQARPVTPPGQAPSISVLRREAAAHLHACRSPSLDFGVGEWADLENEFEPPPLRRRYKLHGEGTLDEENGTKKEEGGKKKFAFVKYAKRIGRFLFHFDGGKTDSRGRPILRDSNDSPDPRHMRGRIRGKTFSGERPIFRDVVWDPSPQLEEGEVRGEEQGEGSGRRRCCAVGTGAAYEGCCGGPSRPTPATLDAEVAAPVHDGVEIDNEDGREHTDRGVTGLEYRSSSEDVHNHAHRVQGGCDCGMISGEDNVDGSPEGEEGYGELSAHPSPFTRLEEDGRYGYF